MAVLEIRGDIKQLKTIAKSESGRARKYNLKISLTEDKQGAKEPLANSKTAPELAEEIAEIESIEDLKQYESETRRVVVAAYKKKLKELS